MRQFLLGFALLVLAVATSVMGSGLVGSNGPPWP